MLKQQILNSIFKNGKYCGNLWRQPQNKVLKSEIEKLQFADFETFNEKVFAILHNLSHKPICQVCNKNHVNFINVIRGYTKTCSIKCSRNSEDWKLKVEQTSIKNYGVKNVFQSSEIKDKIKNTIQQRYNVEFSSQINSMQEKTLETKRQNYINTHFHTLNEHNIEPINWQITDYIDASVEYQFKHITCGTLFSGKFSSNGIPLCPKCKLGGRSLIEQKLANQLIDIFSTERVSINNRTIICPKEIDIVIDNKLGIEVNGVYWHKDDNGKIPLLEKTNMSPIPLLHFWDYELENKLNICKSIICAKLNIFEQKIFARKCKLKKLTSTEAEIFFNRCSFYNFFLYRLQCLVLKVLFGASRKMASTLFYRNYSQK